MKAYQLTAWATPPELREIPVPEPGPGETLVKVGGAGACHSDFHVTEWPAGTFDWELPFTLGHETAGWVESLGPGVSGFEPGEPVAVYGPWGCGRCRACRRSAGNYCVRNSVSRDACGGLGRDGGMAEYILVPEPRLLIPLGDLDPREAAPLTDAALTPYHAVKSSLRLLVPGSTVVLIGIGGLGHMAAQILGAICPARIVAIDSSPQKLALARELGVAETIEAGEDTGRQVLELTGGLGAAVILDMVGTSETIALSCEIVQLEGRVSILGHGGGSFEFGFDSFPSGAELTMPRWGSAIELTEVLELARGGMIRAHTERFPLHRVGDAYGRLRAGEVNGRAVVCPAD